MFKQFLSATILATLLLVVVVPVRADSAPAAERMGHIKSIIADKSQKGIDQENATFVKQQAAESSGALRMVQGLIFCVAVFFIGIYAYKKITGDKPVVKGRRMRILERINIAPKASLVIAEVNGKEVLLAIGEKVSFIDMPGEEAYAEELELLCQQENGLRRSV